MSTEAKNTHLISKISTKEVKELLERTCKKSGAENASFMRIEEDTIAESIHSSKNNNIIAMLKTSGIYADIWLQEIRKNPDRNIKIMDGSILLIPLTEQKKLAAVLALANPKTDLNKDDIFNILENKPEENLFCQENSPEYIKALTDHLITPKSGILIYNKEKSTVDYIMPGEDNKDLSSVTLESFLAKITTESRKTAEDILIRKRTFTEEEITIVTDYGKKKFLLIPIRRNNKQDILILIDIHADRMFTRSMSEQSRLLGIIMDSLTDYIVVVDKESRILYANSAFESWIYLMEKKPLPSLIGKTLPEISKTIANKVEPLITEAQKLGSQIQREIAWHMSLQELVVEATVFPIHQQYEAAQWFIIFHNISNRKKTERLIMQQRQFYQQVLEATPIGVYTLDPLNDFLITLWNKSMEEISGIIRAQTLGLKEEQVFPQEYFAETAVLNQEIISTKKEAEIEELEISFPDKTDSVIINIRKIPILTPLGDVDHILVLVDDITEQKKLDRELAKYREHLEEEVKRKSAELTRVATEMEAILRSTESVAICSMDTDLNIQIFNPTMERLSKMYFKRQPQRGKNLLDIFPIRKIRTAAEKYLIRALKGSTITTRFSFSRKALMPIEMEVVVSPKLDKEKNIIGATIIALDITQRATMEKQLRLFKAISESAPYGTIIVDSSFRIIYANPYTAKIHGMEIGEIMGQNLSVLHTEEQFYKLKEELKKSEETGIMPAQEIWHKYKNGIDFPMLTTATFIKNDMGMTNYIGIISIDMSIQKEAEKKLLMAKTQAEQAARAKSEFLATMSHEIRTPLNAILGFTDLLYNIAEDERELTYLEAIKNSGKNLLLLINDILDLSKIEAGKMQLSYTMVNMIDFINEIASIFTNAAQQKNIDLIKEYNEDIPPSIEIDELRLRQVIFNLVGNAIKFTDKGHIKISLHCKNKTDNTVDIHIKVEDTGIGIKEEEQKAIFETFHQSEGQDNRKYGGTGLGLSISKRLIEMMGGKISLKSKYGEGSCFSVEIPGLKYSTKKVEKEIISNTGIPDLKGKKVLIVDDKELNRNLLVEYLEPTKASCILADDGTTALEEVRKNPPDIILMDIRMPSMSGDEFIKEYYKDEKNRQVPILALTASILKERHQYFKTLGFREVITKPVSREILYRMIAKYLGIDTTTQEKQKKRKSTVEKLPDSLSDEELAIKDEIKKAYHDTIKELAEIAQDTGLTSDMKKLADTAIEYGENLPCKYYKIWGKMMHTAIDSFNIPGIKELINKIENFINSIN
ncbi:PAS domain S-box protein [Spirochaetia bacterium 38H-sp]|uniref:histidine kinase n=1 Tax=Rarispira pelagica TaxID=3141764 RepID=A0ABU9UDM0_9SPIR